MQIELINVHKNPSTDSKIYNMFGNTVASSYCATYRGGMAEYHLH